MKAIFQPAGVITITTDFGHKGPFVGCMKGQMLTRFPEARIVDLSHEIHVHWPAEAGFWIARAYPYFPPGTVHTAVVDPGVGTDRDIILLVHDRHAFMAPDNGLLASLIERETDPLLFRLDNQRLAGLGIEKTSATFHGRDIFAPLSAALAAGEIVPDALGERCSEFVPGWLEEPAQGAGGLRGLVVAVDHFGNLITNIDADAVRALASPIVRVAGKTVRIAHTYGDVRPGDYLCLINSFNVLEIACAEKSAAEGLGLGRGAPVVLAEDA